MNLVNLHDLDDVKIVSHFGSAKSENSHGSVSESIVLHFDFGLLLMSDSLLHFLAFSHYVRAYVRIGLELLSEVHVDLKFFP